MISVFKTVACLRKRKTKHIFKIIFDVEVQRFWLEFGLNQWDEFSEENKYIFFKKVSRYKQNNVDIQFNE